MDDKKDNKPNLTILPVDPEMEQGINERDIESMYVGAGMTSTEIAVKLNLPKEYVKSIVKKNKLSDLRSVYLHRGITKIQNKQIKQAKQILDLEYNFKWMRLKQLEDVLKEYMRYYEKWGDFKRRHPSTLEVLYNQNGIAMQIDIPSVTREIQSLKESVTLSQGLKTLLYQLDSLLNKPKPKEKISDIKPGEEVIDMAIYDAVFKKNRDSDD